jgi:membrane-associated protease RseP (regulator of RpoE activity)
LADFVNYTPDSATRWRYIVTLSRSLGMRRMERFFVVVAGVLILGSPALRAEPCDPCCDGVVRPVMVYAAASTPPLVIRLFPGSDLGAFQKIGFAAGDIVVAVNGRPVTAADDMVNLLREAAGGTALSLSIKRDARVIEWSVSAADAKRALASCGK